MLPLALIADGLMAAAPLIMQYMSGSGEDDAAAGKIKQMRDGLAARLSEGQRIPLSKAQAMVDEQLKPMIDQHTQDSSSGAGSMIAGVVSGIGAARLGGRLAGLGKAAKAAKAAVGAEKAVAAAAPVAAAEAGAVKAAAAEAEAGAGANPNAYPRGAEPADDMVPDGVYTARQAGNDAQMARASTGEMDRVSPGRRRGQRPRLGYDGDIPTVDAEVMPREPSPSPRAWMTRERFNAPFDDPSPMDTGRFVMNDPDPRAIGYDPQAQIMREIQREAAMRRLRSMIRPGD